MERQNWLKEAIGRFENGEQLKELNEFRGSSDLISLRKRRFLVANEKQSL